MRFSSTAVLALVAPVANAFAPIQRQSSAPRTILRKVEYDLDLGIEELPKKGGKKIAPASAPAPPLASEPVPAPKPKKKSASKKVVEVVPQPAPAPVEKKKREKKVKTKSPPPAPPPPPVKKEKKTVASASAFTKVGGVALGAAPLVLAPVVLLGAGRSVLQGTKERREKIQKEIDAVEKAKRKKQIQAEVDGGDLVKAVGFLGAAVVSLVLIIANPMAMVNDQSIKLPSISIPSFSSSATNTPKDANSPPTAIKINKKQVTAQRKAELKLGYDLSLDAEVKKDAKVAKKAVKEEKSLEAQAKKGEAEAGKAAEKEDKAISDETKVSVCIYRESI